MFLFKNVAKLRATYQIRLLLYRAIQEGETLVIDLPKNSIISPQLRELARNYPKHLKFERH